MTQPEGRPLFDAGNAHLDTSFVTTLDIGKIPTPEGEIGIVTIRQGNTTLTVPLPKEQAAQWADLLGQLRDMLSGSGLTVPVQAPLVIATAGQRQ